MLKWNQVGVIKGEFILINFSDDIINKNEEKVLLVNIVGILEVLKRGKLSINEAEKFPFSPYMINKLQKKQCNMEIIDILERGCELEDIASLLPQSLEKNIIELEEKALEIIEKYPNFENKFWI